MNWTHETVVECLLDVSQPPPPSAVLRGHPRAEMDAQRGRPGHRVPRLVSRTPLERRPAMYAPGQAWDLLMEARDRHLNDGREVPDALARHWVAMWRNEQAAGLEPDRGEKDLVVRLAAFLGGRQCMARARQLVMGAR